MTHDAIFNRAPVAAGRLNPELPPGFEVVINKALEKNREMPCQTASEMKTNLKRLKRDTDSSRAPVPAELSARPSSWRGKTALAVGMFRSLRCYSWRGSICSRRCDSNASQTQRRKLLLYTLLCTTLQPLVK